MKRIHLITAILLIVALALPFGTSFVSAQKESDGTALPSVSAEEKSDEILFEFTGGGTTREPATETLVQVSITHIGEVSDELILEKVEIYGESEIPVKAFDVNETLESVADSYDKLKLLSEKFEGISYEEIGPQADALAQEIKSKSFSTKCFTLDLNDLKQSLTLGDRVPIIAKATFIHHGEALVIERSLSVEYQSGLSSSLPELQNWKPGDQHVHTTYSHDGYNSVYEQALAAANADLSWVIITDHHTDMDAGDWWDAGVECGFAQSWVGIQVMLGLEVGSINPLVSEGHYLAYGIFDYVNPPNNCQEMINAVNDQGGFGYIAHPAILPPPNSPNLFPWCDWDVTGYTGIEIMNGTINPYWNHAKWEELLEDPSARIFGIGNGDAHRTSEVGNAITYCYIEGEVTHPSVYSALKNGQSVISNGPLIAFTIGDAKIGDTVAIGLETTTWLDIAWDSLGYGDIQEIQVYTNEGNVKEIDVSGATDRISVPVNVTPQTFHIRLRGIFENGEAYTNPIWVILEDFEWGHDGIRLEYWEEYGGDVDWTVIMGGGGWWRIGVVDISTAHAHTGTRSARFYRDYSFLVASYPQDSPAYRGFYFYFEDDNDDNDANNAKLSTFTGDGENTIYMSVYPYGDDSLRVQYHNGTSWVWNTDTVECPTDEWHRLEFKNIDWGSETYDIYVDGVLVVFDDSPRMAGVSLFEGKTVFFNNGGAQSTFWIDDILS